MAPSPRSRRTQQPLSSSDLLGSPSLRAFLVGAACSSAPALARVIASQARRGSRLAAKRNDGASALLKQLSHALAPGSAALAAAVAIGGAHWAESWLAPVVERACARTTSAKGKERDANGEAVKGNELPATEDAKEGTSQRRRAIATTFVASALAAFAAISVLHAAKPRAFRSTALESGYSVGRPREADLGETRDRPESPTLDATLFLLVRALDTLARGYSRYSMRPKGRRGRLLDALATYGDTLVFAVSASRIMWAWFYTPARLPPSYVRWISALARLDLRVLLLLRHARARNWMYGSQARGEAQGLGEALAVRSGLPSTMGNPSRITRLDCRVVHGAVATDSCASNAGQRWVLGFVDALKIYAPVHLAPQLLFHGGRLVTDPQSFLSHVALGAARSSAFLATFIASIYATVCLSRSHSPLQILGVSQQAIDGGLCTALGCATCGLSILIENKRRRREMALYCAPRALYACMDDILPAVLMDPRNLSARMIERVVFSTSLAALVTATVHEPSLVSGFVRPVLSFAIGDWNKKS